MGFSGVKRTDLNVPRPVLDTAALRGKKLAIIGGTAGIGRALALCSAKRGAQVIIVGRTHRDPPTPGVEFLGADLSSMKAAAQLGQKLPDDLDALIFTNGIMAAPQREVTEEGIERDLAVSYLSRFVVARELAPKLDARSKAHGSRARVFVMGFPGTDSQLKVDVEDLNAEKRYAAMDAHMATVAGNEVLVLDLARRFTNLDVFGLNPGLIKTDIRANFMGEGSLKHRLSEWFIGVLMQSAEDYAEKILPILFAPELTGHSGAMFNAKGAAIHASEGVGDDYVARFTAQAEALARRTTSAAP